MTADDLVRQIGTAVRVSVRVQPRASRSAVQGIHGGAWRVRVQAPPVDGAANDAVCDLFAEVLDVPRRQVRIVSGASGRTKVVEIAGSTSDAVRARLSAASEAR